MAPTRPFLPPLSTPKTMIFPSELRDPDPVSHTCLDSAKSVKFENPPPETETSITPPSAYTEFLNTFSPIFASPDSSRANFSKYMLDRPRPSPTSAPPGAVSFSSRAGYQHYSRHEHGHGHRRNNSNGSGNSMKHAYTIPSPRRMKSQSPIKNINLNLSQNHQTQDHARRLRQNQGVGVGQLYTPMTASPLSANAISHPHMHTHRLSPSEWRFHQLESPAASPDGGSFSLKQVVTTTITFRVAPRLADPPVGKRKRAEGVRKNA